MFNRHVMAAHQLFSFSPLATFLLLYLPLKIHFKASLLELVITLCPPPHQLQDQSHGERLSSFASFLSSSTSRNDKHLLSSAVPPFLALPTPPAVPILYICQPHAGAAHPVKPEPVCSLSLLACTWTETGASPGTNRFPSLLRELPGRSGGHYCTWQRAVLKQSAAVDQQAPAGQTDCMMSDGQLWNRWSLNLAGWTEVGLPR